MIRTVVRGCVRFAVHTLVHFVFVFATAAVLCTFMTFADVVVVAFFVDSAVSLWSELTSVDFHATAARVVCLLVTYAAVVVACASVLSVFIVVLKEYDPITVKSFAKRFVCPMESPLCFLAEILPSPVDVTCTPYQLKDVPCGCAVSFAQLRACDRSMASAPA